MDIFPSLSVFFTSPHPVINFDTKPLDPLKLLWCPTLTLLGPSASCHCTLLIGISLPSVLVTLMEKRLSQRACQSLLIKAMDLLSFVLNNYCCLYLCTHYWIHYPICINWCLASLFIHDLSSSLNAFWSHRVMQWHCSFDEKCWKSIADKASIEMNKQINYMQRAQIPVLSLDKD